MYRWRIALRVRGAPTLRGALAATILLCTPTSIMPVKSNGERTQGSSPRSRLMNSVVAYGRHEILDGGGSAGGFRRAAICAPGGHLLGREQALIENGAGNGFGVGEGRSECDGVFL